jgi:adenine C2-methylase RlmN of 23S rRNA A2503 and tRNA A37
MGQFSVNAFKKYLLKCKNVEHDSIKSKERGYSEDQWIQRQSDYVRYLWESYQKINFSKIESDDIWKNTYEILKQEFKDFKDLHKNIEDKLDKEKITNKEEMVKELLSRLANNEQSLDDTTTKNLIASLQEKVAQNKKH